MLSLMILVLFSKQEEASTKWLTSAKYILDVFKQQTPSLDLHNVRVLGHSFHDASVTADLQSDPLHIYFCIHGLHRAQYVSNAPAHMACLWIKLQASVHSCGVFLPSPAFNSPLTLILLFSSVFSCLMQGFPYHSNIFQKNSAFFSEKNYHCLERKLSKLHHLYTWLSIITIYLEKTWSDDPSSSLFKFKLFLFLKGLQRFADPLRHPTLMGMHTRLAQNFLWDKESEETLLLRN